MGLSRFAFVGLAALGVVALTGCAQDSMRSTSTFNTTLSGAQEVPPVNTAGRGEAKVTVDRATRQLTWEVGYNGLTGPVTAAHFHGPAAPGQNAGVVVPIAQGPATNPMRGSAMLTEEQMNQLLQGRWYINLHTEQNKGGEIRGQVNPG